MASQTFERICGLVTLGAVRISDHGYDELAADRIFARDVIAGVTQGIVVEDYPDYPRGACVLVLQTDRDSKPIHVVWGIPKGHIEPAVVITAYRPDSTKWENDFLQRRS